MEFISFASWRKDNQDLEAQLKDEGFECYACHAEGQKECPTCGHDDPCETCNGEGWIVEPTGEDLKHGMFAAYEEQKKADLERWRSHATR